MAEGQFVTTDLIVSTKFLNAHPDVVKQLIEGRGRRDRLHRRPTAPRPRRYVVAGIQKATGKPIAADLVTASFENITFTTDPIVSSLLKDAKDAKALGFPTADDVKGIYDLSIPQQGPEGKQGDQPRERLPANGMTADDTSS